MGGGGASAAVTTKLVGSSANNAWPASAVDELTGRYTQVVRAYHAENQPLPRTLAAAGILDYLSVENRHVVYSIKIPDSSAATYQACEQLAADIATRGYLSKVWLILWHEPYGDMSSTVFVDRYRAIAPAIRGHGVRCGVCFHTYPIWHKGLDYTTYWPGDDVTDFMGIDTYPPDTPDANPNVDDRATRVAQLSANPLATITPLTSFVKARGKPFGIAEFGVPADRYALPDSNGTPVVDPELAALAGGWIDRFQRLGASCQFLTYWNPPRLAAHGGVMVPAYQRLYDHFNS